MQSEQEQMQIVDNALLQKLGRDDYLKFIATNPTYMQKRERLATEKNRIANAPGNKNTGVLRRITTGMLREK